ncbi:hypothetical protein KA012_02470 [Candidatus Woesebacteria bacterium]|nr:hypothetical protein [Candidatus Woesebacteria bacterium]
MIESSQTKAKAAELYHRLHGLAQGGSESAEQAQVQPTAQEQPMQAQMDEQPNPSAFARATTPQESAIMPGMFKPLPEELLLDWVAPSRPFRKPNRRFFSTVTMIAVLIGLILFFANQMLPVAVVVAVVFLTYVLFSIPPSDVRYRLTTYGVRIEDQLYHWEELGRFWYTQQYAIDILHIEVARFPNTIHFLLGDIEKEMMTAILSEVLLHQRPPLTIVEKAGVWLQEKVPLDLES